MNPLRESLLDRYPLRDHELDRLLGIFAVYEHCDERSTPRLSSCLVEDEFTDIVVSVETDILPELSQIFQQEYKNAAVVGIFEHEQPELHARAKFMETAITLTGRGSAQALAARLYQAFGDDCSPSRIADFILRLAKAAYLLHFRSLVSRGRNETRIRETMAESLSTLSSLKDERDCYLSPIQIKVWLEGQAKHAVHLLSTVFHYALLGATLVGTNLQNDSFSNPRYKSSLFNWITGCERQSDYLNDLSGFWKHPLDPVPFHLSLMGLGGPWFQKDRRLYNSDEDGLAFSSFSHALVSFMGPTLVLIRTTENEVLGFYTALPWKNGPKWYSTSSDEASFPMAVKATFLLRIQPSWTCYNMMRDDATSDSPLKQTVYTSSRCFHQFLNTPVSYRRGQGPLEGLAIGGIAADIPRLHLHPSLEGCYAGTMDTTFESGSLLKKERDVDAIFDVDALEVWAIRSETFCDDLAAGKLIASTRESTRLHIAQVDKRQFVDDFATGMVISELYCHRDQSWGRAEFTVDDAK
ncbi:hypothetical protein FisN_1Lh443 [Fistulifera solaris]|uniref:TLDc domain-containing protein n=1 Tax=Fistulifera solaris TaxID=1519565 RepID=A0A1Z5K3R8_FISSO|nr:hypothetical protein FisN_1Lh443 [Fistulifera solaris]|eukprot:GAX20903.1 hypothetical protein FisN_1Lh443 [Fistulifera solaris]